MRLYGREMTRREIEAATGDTAAFFGVRLATLGDGVERGVRMLEFRTGTGLRFTVMIDRAMDLAECEINGMALGWVSPTGFRNPGLHEYEGEGGLGFLRSFSGLLVTCGLDHALFMYEVDAAEYRYAARETVRHSLHGRVGMIPARLTGYGERWDGDRCTLWAEGVVRQAAVYGEALELTRRIEVEAGTNDIRIHDVVRNRGWSRTPHMYLYHVNLGAPLLAEGSRYLAPVRDVVWAGHAERYEAQGVGYRTLSGPHEAFHEQVWEFDLAADAEGRVVKALVNDGLGIGFEVTTLKSEFPCAYEWQHLQAGQYAIGIEPASHHVVGDGFARERGEMIWLEHGDQREYHVGFRVLDGVGDIADSEARIRAIGGQPEADYPAISGAFPELRDAHRG